VMMAANERDLNSLRQKLPRACFDNGIGFRLTDLSGGPYQGYLGLKISQQHEGDLAIELRGLRLYMDPARASYLIEHELD